MTIDGMSLMELNEYLDYFGKNKTRVLGITEYDISYQRVSIAAIIPICPSVPKRG